VQTDTPEPIITLLIVMVTAIISGRAFVDVRLRDKFLFSTYPILAGQEYYRLITSAFIHADVRHLFFNLISLYFFGRELEPFIGREHLLLIYFGGVIGGGLLALFLHRHHDYRALGASGGVCGIIFASIFLMPDGKITMLPLPIGIPTWLYAGLFMLAEFKGLRSPQSNCGHAAHLGGAITGLLITTALYPYIVSWSPWLYATVMGISGAVLFYLWINPLRLPLKNFLVAEPALPAPHAYPPPHPTEEEVDVILEKISAAGLHSLSEKERRILTRASGK